MIECVETGLVYRNPKPHLKSIHAWHPSLVRLDDGELVAAFDLGEAVESLDYCTYIARSRDDGRTWEPPERLFHDDTDCRATHSVRIGRTLSGTIIGLGGRYYRESDETGLVNRDNLGYTKMDLLTLYSEDGGRAWTDPAVIAPPLVGPSFEICHSIVELSDGRWLAPVSTWKGWNGEAPNGMKAIALVSHDQGRSWPEHLDVMDDYANGIIHWEQSLVELGDGRLLAVAWVVDEQSGRTLPSVYSISGDGQTFSAPRASGMHGQTAKIIRLADGRILCLYRADDRAGLWAELVEIDGDRWIRVDEARLWTGAPSGMTGQSNTVDELSALKFGYPSMALLPNGDALAVFWCCEDDVHNIRWMRVRIG